MEPSFCADSPLVEEVRQRETIRVIVQLAGEFRPEAELSEEDVARQRARIRQLQDQVIQELSGTRFQLLRRFENLPIAVFTVGEGAMCSLLNSDLVAGVELDEVDRAFE